MKHKDLPERWKEKLKEYLELQGNNSYNKLSASDFPMDLKSIFILMMGHLPLSITLLF